MNDLRPNIAGQTDTNTPAVLYGLLQAENSQLSVPLSGIGFGTPQLNTQAQSAANGNTTSNVAVSAAGYGAPVTIFYNQVALADHVVQPNTNSGGYVWQPNSVPVFFAPYGTYATTYDFVAALQAAGFPITSADIVNTTLQNYWSDQYSGYYYQSLGYQYLEWDSSALGYTSCLFVAYGPSVTVPFEEAFPQSYFSALQTGDAATALAQYNNYYLSQNGSPEGSGSALSRACTTYSGLTVLDSATSTANGGAEVSALVTYATNPNYLPTSYDPAPFWPFYTGAQTVYYTRYSPTTDVAAILTNNSGNGYAGALEYTAPFLLNGAFRFPLGSQLGAQVATAHNLVTALTAAGWNLGFDLTDVVDGPLPTTYGEDGTAIYNLTFQGSYMVQDGQLPITLMQTGPDMTVVQAGVTDFPVSAFVSQWGYLLYNADGLEALGTAVWYWLCGNYLETVLNYTLDEACNWMFSCVATAVAGSVQPTTSEVAAAHSGCGFQATISVVTPWQTSFEFPIYFDKVDLAGLAADAGYTASPGAFNATVASNVMSVPMRVIDWILATVNPVGSSNNPTQLANFVNYRELTNLNELVLRDANGNLSFTLTAPSGSNLMQGAVTVTLSADATASPSETSFSSPTGGIGWQFTVP